MTMPYVLRHARYQTVQSRDLRLSPQSLITNHLLISKINKQEPRIGRITIITLFSLAS